MKHLRRILDSIIYPTCALTIVIEAIFLLIGFNTSQNFEQPGLDPRGFITMLLFSLAVIISLRIFSLKIHLAARIAIHFASCTAVFFVFFMLLSGYYADRGASSLLVLFVFALAYAAIAAPILIVRYLLAKKKNESATYKSMLTKTEE